MYWRERIPTLMLFAREFEKERRRRRRHLLHKLPQKNEEILPT
jgi:hypothetical protein